MSNRTPGLPESPDDPLVGTVLAGKYKIRDVLARGGMGRIYRAEQMPLGRIVAIKVLSVRFEAEEDPGFSDRFFLEAATLARLKHPNTVTVFDYGHEGDDLWYMVMEYVEGQPLSNILRNEGSIETARALRIAYEIARALTEAHNLGIVHRDLKPSNVMVLATEEGEAVKVVDFGIVKVLEASPVLDTITRPDRMVGSPRYMAPEQIRKGDIDGRTDIYSLGVVLYEMLTGVPPFKGDNSVKTLMAHLTEVVPPMAEMTQRSIPLPAEQLVKRCLQKKPENRFPDITAFKKAVRSVLVDMGAAPADTLDTSGEYRMSSQETPAPEQDSTTLATAPIAEEEARQAMRSRRTGLLFGVGFVGLFALSAIAGWVLLELLPDPGEALPHEVIDVAPAPTPDIANVAPAPTTPEDPNQPYLTSSVWFTSVPEGAQVWEGALMHGPTPLVLRLRLVPGDPPRTFEVRSAGYQPFVVTQGPSPKDVDVVAALVPTQGPKPTPAPTPAPTPGPAMDIRINR